MSRKENDITKEIKSESYKGYNIKFDYDYYNIEVRVYKNINKYNNIAPISDYFVRVNTKAEGMRLAKDFINQSTK